MMGKALGAEGLAGTRPHGPRVTEGNREAAEALAHGRRAYTTVRPRRPAVGQLLAGYPDLPCDPETPLLGTHPKA